MLLRTAATALLALACLGCCVNEKPIDSDPFTAMMSEYEGRDGKAEALADIEAGHPKYKTYGFPHPASFNYARIMKRKIGVEYDPIAGCCVDEPLLKYAEAYNKVTERHLEKKYGADIMTKLWEEAMAEYNQSVEKNKKKASDND